MRLGRQLATVLLLTFWFGAAEHCTLEAAGWIPGQCVQDCGEGSDAVDGCDVVENAVYKNTTAHLRLTESVVVLDRFLPAVLLAVEPPVRAVRPPGVAEPRLLTRSWQFLQRAAPPSRAPAVIG